MSLNWNWTDKMGTCEYENGDTGNIYQGNALMIVLGENEENYWMQWFAADENHLKNQLGLTNGYDNCIKHFGVKKITLNTKYKSVPKIVQMIAKAKMNITIELRGEPDEN